MVGWFTFSKDLIDKHISLLSYLYGSNLNVPDISFQPLFIYIKLLVKKTLTTAHIMIHTLLHSII